MLVSICSWLRNRKTRGSIKDNSRLAMVSACTGTWIPRLGHTAQQSGCVADKKRISRCICTIQQLGVILRSSQCPTSLLPAQRPFDFYTWDTRHRVTWLRWLKRSPSHVKVSYERFYKTSLGSFQGLRDFRVRDSISDFLSSAKVLAGAETRTIRHALGPTTIATRRQDFNMLIQCSGSCARNQRREERSGSLRYPHGAYRLPPTEPDVR